MLILPVGTKSTLALKPIITISLICICMTVHLLSGMSGGNVEEDLFKVHRDLYADQVHLFLIERNMTESGDDYLYSNQEAAIESMRYSSDYAQLEMALFEAMGHSFTCIEAIEEFGSELAKRDGAYYADSPRETEVHADWLKGKDLEDKVLGRLPTYSLGLVPKKMNRVWTFVTHLFLHGDIWHLLGNMLFLWVVGCLLEDTWGRWPFLAFYIAGGIFAGWAHCLQDTHSSMPLIGASGAIAAAMGAFTIRHFMTKIKFFYFFVFFFRPMWGTFHLPAFVWLPFWFIQQVALKSLSDYVGGSNVAYLAHIAGYMAGVVTALVIKGTGLEERWLDPMVQKKQVDEGVLKDPRFDEACELMRGGGVERAKILFSQLLAERPADHNLAQDIAVIYREIGMDDECGKLSEVALKGMILRSEMEEATGVTLDMISSGSSAVINPQLLMRVGKYLSKQDRNGEAHDVYRYVIRANVSPPVTAKTSIALAKLLNGPMNNYRDAVDVLEEAKNLDIDPQLKATVTEMQSMIMDTAAGVLQT